jgi:hypothetical protein
MVEWWRLHVWFRDERRCWLLKTIINRDVTETEDGILRFGD